MTALRVRVHDAVREVSREAWNALLAPGATPFLEWDWLDVLEEAGTVRDATGWRPQHLTLWDGARLVGACPLYVKSHSMGEFVFDQSWAAAAQRAGIDYYPKLLVAVPFTPATGARILAAPEHRDAVVQGVARVLEDLPERGAFSSVHVNFCRADEASALAARGWLRRTGYQYHWSNAGYATFDDWVGALRSKRRNQTRRELRELEAQGVRIDALVGDDIPASLVPTMFRLYRDTVRQFTWGQQYLNERFFELIHERWRHRLCWIVARQGDEVIAGTFNVQGDGVFYGRYWGAQRSLRHLHFNVCYYAAIRHCIEAGLARFEPGAGGEFKHLRGFDAAATESLHWIAHPGFRRALDHHLTRERELVEAEMAWLDERTAHRRGPADADDGEA